MTVFELPENELPSGTHLINLETSSPSSGIYVYKVNAKGINGENFVGSKKMIKE